MGQAGRGWQDVTLIRALRDSNARDVPADATRPRRPRLPGVDWGDSFRKISETLVPLGQSLFLIPSYSPRSRTSHLFFLRLCGQVFVLSKLRIGPSLVRVEKWTRSIFAFCQPHRLTTLVIILLVPALSLEAIASRLEAIPIRLEAIASSLEAIPIRLEAIASSLEAIAIRLEAIAIFIREALEKAVRSQVAGRSRSRRSKGAPDVLTPSRL